MPERKHMNEYTDAELADVLDAAADEIMIRGGTCGEHINVATGEVCLYGAIGLALGYEPTEWGSFLDSDRSARGDHGALSLGPNRLRNALKERVGRPAWAWNDELREDPEADDKRIELLRTTAKEFRNADSASWCNTQDG